MDREGGGDVSVMTHVNIPADSPGAAEWIMAFERLAAQAEGGAT
jgi:hypothetical protein